MIRRTLLLATAIGAGVATSQAPEFAQQYRQRLGGAVDELRRVVMDFDRDAATAGLDRGKAIATLQGDGQRIVQLRGDSIAGTVARYERLSAQQQAFEASGPLGRIEAVFSSPDPELVGATWNVYEPAVPTTLAGAVTAGIGFLAVYLLAGLGTIATGPLRRRRRKLREREALVRERA